MPNSVIFNGKIGKFNRVISVSGDKSLSIRWVLFSSLANGKSKATNLLMSEDVLDAIILSFLSISLKKYFNF